MSAHSEPQSGVQGALLARVAQGAARDEARIDAAIDDLFLRDDDRLDDRIRARMTALLASSVDAIEQDILAHANRVAGVALTGGTLRRLIDSGLLRDRALGSYLLGAARLELMGEALAAGLAQSDRSDLLVRLCSVRDGVVASAAAALLGAINRARVDGRDGVPSDVHARLVWWVAAALHEQATQADCATALVEAATRSLQAHDDAASVRALGMRLAMAIDARPEEVGGLLIETLADARPALFVAVLAHAARVAPGEVLAITLDPPGERLWVTLRALRLDRATIARIGLLLSEADPRRDVEAFAEQLDAIMAIDEATADAAMRLLRLDADFRAAQRALARAPGR